jgi:hypothetical protein
MALLKPGLHLALDALVAAIDAQHLEHTAKAALVREG